MPPSDRLTEWTLHRSDGDVECIRRLLPPGVIDLAVLFRGLVVASWTTTVPTKAAEWVNSKRRAWESAAAASQPAES